MRRKSAGVRVLYSLLFYALLPGVLARLLWKSRLQPAYRQRLGERFGFYAGPPVRDVLWLHAVSVGECEAAFPVIKSLLSRGLDTVLLITCITPNGSARIRDVLGDQVLHVYLPYDLPDAIRRFLDHFKPRLGVIMETEIWPNLFAACRTRDIPLAIINGRLSDESASGYARLPGLTRDSLAAVRCIAAQTPADAERYITIGAAPDTVRMLGNIKFDIDFDDALQARAASLRKALFQARPVLIAGSTHPGEEELILDALAQVRQSVSDLLLILAPRHPERAAEVRTLCESRGLAVCNRSASQVCAATTQVFLVDGIGELRTFYGTADVAFIGGSLVPHGGQNVLEAAVTGIPVLFGPYTMNFREITAQLIEVGGGIRVEDENGLADEVINQFGNPLQASEIGRKARAFVEANRGAVERVTNLLVELWPAH